MRAFFDSIQSTNIKVVDLSHTVSSDCPTWTGSCGFKGKNLLNYGEDLFRVQSFEMLAGLGTHLDSPSHLFKGKHTIDQIPLHKLFFPITVINVGHKTINNPVYKVTVSDLEEDERINGTLTNNSLIIFNTGWAKYWNDCSRYRNTTSKNIMQFPSISEEVAQTYLDILVGVGIDTLSPDGGDISQGFPVHEVLLRNDRLIIENVNNNIHELPPRGAFGMCLPSKIAGCTESPVRLIAFYK